MATRRNHLGPHSTMSSRATHEHHTWIGQFKAPHRRALVSEDRRARNTVAALLFTVMGVGVLLMLITVVECM